MVLIIASMGFGALVSYPHIVRMMGEAWLAAVIMGFAMAAFSAFLCGFLVYKFPNQTIFEYAPKLLGRPLSKILNVVYFGFFLIGAALLLNRFSYIVSAVLLPRTPSTVVLGTLLIATIFLSSRGINIISNVAKILISIAIVTILVMLISTLKKFNFEETYGMWRWQTTDFRTTLLSSVSVFFGFEFILIMGGFSSRTKKIMITAPFAVLIVGAIVFLTQFIMVGVFGTGGITHLKFPTIELAKTIAFQTSIAQRFDVIYMFGWIISLFLTIAIMQYCAAFSLAYFTKMKDYSLYALLLSPIILFVAAVPNQQQIQVIEYYYAVLGIVVAFVIPILLVAVALFRRKKLQLLLLIILMFPGCWDSHEINNYSYVLGISIDRVDSGEIMITYQIADLKQEDATKNVSAVGKTFASAQNKIASFGSKEISLEHTRVIVLGESLAREDISEFILNALRELHIRCSTPVVIAQGSAAELLEIKTELFVGMAQDNGNILTDSNVLDIAESLWQQGDCLVQMMGKKEDECEILGGAIIRGNKMVGVLSRENLVEYRMLTDGVKRIGINLELGEATEIDAILTEVNTKINATLEEEIPRVKVEVTGEYAVVEKGYSQDEAYMARVDKLINNEVAQKCREVVDIAQKQTNADFLGFGRGFKNSHREWWEQKNTYWREIMPSVPVEINVCIRRIS